MYNARSPIGIGTLIVIIAAIVGGVICIVHPELLSFQTYFTMLITGGAVTAVGHGIDSGTGSAP
jgi:hypothetical protein